MTEQEIKDALAEATWSLEMSRAQLQKAEQAYRAALQEMANIRFKKDGSPENEKGE